MTRRDNHILILIDAQSSSCLSRYTTVTRALALALMRQAKEYLAATNDVDAADQLQRAIDTLLTPRTPVAA